MRECWLLSLRVLLIIIVVVVPVVYGGGALSPGPLLLSVLPESLLGRLSLSSPARQHVRLPDLLRHQLGPLCIAHIIPQRRGDGLSRHLQLVFYWKWLPEYIGYDDDDVIVV